MSTPVIGAQNHLLDTALTITSTPAEDAAFPLSNASDHKQYTEFKPGSSVTEVLVTIDAGVGNTIDTDYFGIVGHDLFDPAEDGLGPVTYQLQRSDDASFWSTYIGGAVAASNNIIFSKSVTETRRAFRLRMTRGSAFIPTIGQLHIGKTVEFPYGVRVGYDPQSEKHFSLFPSRQEGNIIVPLSRWIEKRATVDLQLLENTFVRDVTANGFQKFWEEHASKMLPFFWSWNPGLQNISTNPFEDDTIFGVVEPNTSIRRPMTTQNSNGLRSIRFSLIGLKDEGLA